MSSWRRLAVAGSALRIRADRRDDDGWRDREAVGARSPSRRESVAKGPCKDDGALAHDFRIAGKKTLLMKGRATLRVFGRAGRFPYLCTVQGHAGRGR